MQQLSQKILYSAQVLESRSLDQSIIIAPITSWNVKFYNFSEEPIYTKYNKNSKTNICL